MNRNDELRTVFDNLIATTDMASIAVDGFSWWCWLAEWYAPNPYLARVERTRRRHARRQRIIATWSARRPQE